MQGTGDDATVYLSCSCRRDLVYKGSGASYDVRLVWVSGSLRQCHDRADGLVTCLAERTDRRRVEGGRDPQDVEGCFVGGIAASYAVEVVRNLLQRLGCSQSNGAERGSGAVARMDLEGTGH